MNSSPLPATSGRRLGRITASTEQASAAARSPSEVGVSSETRMKVRMLAASETIVTTYQSGWPASASRPGGSSTWAGKSVSSGTQLPASHTSTPAVSPLTMPLRLAPGQ